MANPVDFRARQIQTHKIIANDPDSTTGNRIVIYDVGADINALPNHGHVDAGVFPEFYLTGSDVFFYVSGARNDKGSVTPGVSVFAGDVVMSGSFYQGFGLDTKGGIYSHAEGHTTIANGDYSHAEGGGTTASSIYSHAEGNTTIASGESSHAEGRSTTSGGDYSHAEGYSTNANTEYSHTEGNGSYTFDLGKFNPDRRGYYAHTEGKETSACGNGSHAEGYQTATSGAWSHAEGSSTTAAGFYSHAEGSGSYTFDAGTLKATGEYAHVEGESCSACGIASHAEGNKTATSGSYSHSEGAFTLVSGESSHAEGRYTLVSSNYSHAEGYLTTASADYSHAEGYGTCTNTQGSHAEGYYSYTFDAESAGQNGRYAHVEGENCSACGDSSHAEGYQTAASGAYSHAGGIGTITKKQGQTAIGQWNTDNNTNSLFVVGNGAEILRSDIFKIEETGEIVLAGGVQHNALYDTNSPGSPLYLDKTNYLAIINSQAGNRNVYLPEIDVGNPAASVGLTVVIRQDDTSPSTRTVTIHVPTANSSYRINGFNLAAATLTLNAAPIPVVNASVTLTFMGVIGGTGRWFVTSVSQC